MIKLGTYMSCHSVEHGEEPSHVLLARNMTKELSLGKFCCPKTAIEVQCHLVANNEL